MDRAFVYKIGENSKVNKKVFEIIIIRDNNLNAFAAPGGIIGINVAYLSILITKPSLRL